MKKVGKYVAITFLLLMGLGCVGVLYLFFIPNASLFGISYINNKDLLKSSDYNIEGVDQINLTSVSYNVNIIGTDQSVARVEVFSNSFGFVSTKTKVPTIESSIKNKVLTLNVGEPQGFAIKNNSYVNLYIPNNINTVDLNLKNKKAKTKFDSADLVIKNLTYETNDGDFNFVSGKISGNLNLTLNKSTFTISPSATTNSNPVDLSITSGKFYAENSTLGNINIKQNQRGVISINECSDVIQNSSSSGGRINIKKLQNITLTAGDTILTIDEVAFGATKINMTKSGSVKIGKLIDQSDIITNSGDIVIDNCESIAVLHTDSGNITVNNAKKRISIKTNYGKATVKFAQDAESYETDSTSRVLYATIHNGLLNAEGVEHIGVTNEQNSYTIEGINVTGNGRVNLKMNKVCGANSIAGKNGNVNLIIEHSAQYILKTSSTSGSVRVNLLQISSYRGYTTKELKTTNVNCSTSENSLSVSTGYGDLTILDTKIYEYGF